MEFKIIRKVDALGRIVIPKDLRNLLGLENGTNVEIKIDNESIVIKNAEQTKNDSRLRIKKSFSLDLG